MRSLKISKSLITKHAYAALTHNIKKIKTTVIFAHSPFILLYIDWPESQTLYKKGLKAPCFSHTLPLFMTNLRVRRGSLRHCWGPWVPPQQHHHHHRYCWGCRSQSAPPECRSVAGGGGVPPPGLRLPAPCRHPGGGFANSDAVTWPEASERGPPSSLL